MSTSSKRIHLHNAVMKNLFSFPNNEKFDLSSCDHDTESIDEQQQKNV